MVKSQRKDSTGSIRTGHLNSQYIFPKPAFKMAPSWSKRSVLHYPSTSNERIADSEESATSQSDSEWGTESEDNVDKEKKASSWENAEAIIDQIGESWTSEFNGQVGPIKSDFKRIADRVENMMRDEAQLAKALSNQLEIYHSDDHQISDHIVGEFGESLESAVRINDTIRDLQRKIKALDDQMKKEKETFVIGLAVLKAKNLEEIEEFKHELSVEADSIPTKIQEAKSTKAEQKQIQLKLAKILANGFN